MRYKRLRITKENGIATIRLDRPEKKNAMDPEMHREMGVALGALKTDEAVRVVVLTGSGDSFCAGQDLKAFFAETYNNPMHARTVTAEAMDWAETLRLFPKPTIVAVNGWCIGGGLRVMGLCDIAIASDRAQFGLSEVNFGNFPAGGSMKMTMELLSHRDALYMALTGDFIDAATAERLRLVTRTVPHEQLMEEVYSIAKKLTEKNPVALMITKEVFWRDKRMAYSEAVSWELAKQAELSYLQNGEWVREGINRFIKGSYKPAFGSYMESSSAKTKSVGKSTRSKKGVSDQTKSGNGANRNGRDSK